jgi:hypothetical protein
MTDIFADQLLLGGHGFFKVASIAKSGSSRVALVEGPMIPRDAPTPKNQK